MINTNLTNEEISFLVSMLEPYEDELGMDISILIYKLNSMKQPNESCEYVEAIYID